VKLRKIRKRANASPLGRSCIRLGVTGGGGTLAVPPPGGLQVEGAVEVGAEGFVGQEQSNRVLELIQGHCELIEPAWVSRRLQTLEARMESWQTRPRSGRHRSGIRLS